MKQLRVAYKSGFVQVFVDDQDYAYVQAFRWYITKNTTKYGNNFYARRKIRLSAHVYVFLSMQSDLLDVPACDVDHVNRNGLDNQRNNLRAASRVQNSGNRPKVRGTSRFKGVYWEKRLQKWCAGIAAGGKHKHLGVFVTEAEAAQAYDKAAIAAFGKFAWLNFTLEKVA